MASGSIALASRFLGRAHVPQYHPHAQTFGCAPHLHDLLLPISSCSLCQPESRSLELGSNLTGRLQFV